MKTFLIGLTLCAAVVAVASAQTKYGAKATVGKNVDFAALKTYSWTKGRPSPDKTIDAQITAAVDQELSALGLTKAASGPGDVLATYYSLTRTDVNLKAKPDANGARPQYAVGSLLIALLDPTSRQRLLQLRADKPIDTEPAKLHAAINEAVAELFTLYPTRRK